MSDSAVGAEGDLSSPPSDQEDERARHRVQVVLTAGGALVIAVMALPVLASFTSVLDGVVAGVGVAYIVGFAEFVLALVGAVAYCRWIDRFESLEDRRGQEPAA
jgi:uncharacterized membrane protein (DUF485 family)